MEEKILDQIAKLLEMFNDPDDLMILAENPDYHGNDCFWYLDEYDMYSILDCRIMDRLIQKKWNGKYTANSHIMDTSISFTLLQDEFGLFTSDRIFSEIKLKMFNFDSRD
jgi:hypothetical protein